MLKQKRQKTSKGLSHMMCTGVLSGSPLMSFLIFDELFFPPLNISTSNYANFIFISNR